MNYNSPAPSKQATSAVRAAVPKIFTVGKIFSHIPINTTQNISTACDNTVMLLIPNVTITEQNLDFSPAFIHPRNQQS